MACGVCEHCMSPVACDNAEVIGRYSYHKKCRKCYVCSETDLHDAEVFKGVIFCAGCSQRIFQGCSTARHAKTLPRRRRERRERRAQSQKPIEEHRVIEAAMLARSSTRLKHDSGSSGKSEQPPTPAPHVSPPAPGRLKRRSAENGMSTDVTSKLLRDLTCHFIIDCDLSDRSSSRRDSLSDYKTYTKTKEETPCSDLRIAELGASTEIATLALRKHSGSTFKKSGTRMKTETVTESSKSAVTEETDDTTDESKSTVEWLDSVCDEYRGVSQRNRHLLNRHVGSLLKMPYKKFKKNILMRSSLISVLMSSENEKDSLYKRFKMLFQEEIADHQHRGMKKLYETINRQERPYKMGWLQLPRRNSRMIRSRQCLHIKRGCRHYEASHSYRCMRSQAMRLAGPTKSEMKNFRIKVKNYVPPFLKKVASYNKKYVTIMSDACGSGRVASSAPFNKIIRSV